MRIAAYARTLPARVTAGAFIFNAGLTKWSADEETAARLHGMAAGTYPFLTQLKAEDFARLLSVSEMALGTALLLPVIPAELAGAGLTGFAGGLLGLYVKTPGMRREGSLRPSQQGTALAKDVWLLGMGLSLVADGLAERFSSGGG